MATQVDAEVTNTDPLQEGKTDLDDRPTALDVIHEHNPTAAPDNSSLHMNNINMNQGMSEMNAMLMMHQQRQQQQQQAAQIQAQQQHAMMMQMMMGNQAQGMMGGHMGDDANYNTMLAQLMMNPMAVQMMQGVSPMMLMGMGGSGGGMVQNSQFSAHAMGGMGHNINGHAFAPDPVQLQLPPVINVRKQSKKKMKVKGKPKRPLSAYNYFFREERARILEKMPKEDGEDQKKESLDDDNDTKVNKEDKEGTKPTKNGGKKKKKKKEVEEVAEEIEDEGENDKGYNDVEESGKKIPGGRIGFEKLARQIGERWKKVEAEEMAKYKAFAAEDMVRYKKEMEVFLSKEAVEGSYLASAGTCSMHPYNKSKKTKAKKDVEIMP